MNTRLVTLEGSPFPAVAGDLGGLLAEGYMVRLAQEILDAGKVVERVGIDKPVLVMVTDDNGDKRAALWFNTDEDAVLYKLSR